VGGIELFDHLDRCPAILRDLVDICPLHQTQADVGMRAGCKRCALDRRGQLSISLRREWC
jgi:hypothetical protein